MSKCTKNLFLVVLLLVYYCAVFSQTKNTNLPKRSETQTKNNFKPKKSKIMPQKNTSLKTETDKLIILQMMFHLWGNKNTNNIENGTLKENGVTKFGDISDLALKKLQKFGYTHLYMTGLLEHATKEDFSDIGIPKDNPEVIKGQCGSPFAIKDYYDVNPFFADKPEKRIEEFEQMLQRIHANDLKLIMDFVPNHLARVYKSDMKPNKVVDFGKNDDTSKQFDPNNNFYYLSEEFTVPIEAVNKEKNAIHFQEKPAKVSGNDVFTEKPNINDWYETVKLNYGVDHQNFRQKHFDPTPNTWLKMTDILKYWASKGVDGFRCDMAEMVPYEFWQYAIKEVKKKYPKTIFIAEIYNPKAYHDYIKIGGFDYLYDKVGLYDGLRKLVGQKHDANTSDITAVWQHESGDISQHMLRFLENHDEIRINSKEFSNNNPFAAIPAMVVSATLHAGPVMLYFGQELGETAFDKEGFNQADDRTTMFDFWGVKTHQQWMNNGKFDGAGLNNEQLQLQSFYKNLLGFSQENKAIYKGNFFDLQYAQNYQSKKIYSYIRYTKDQKLLFVCNFDQNDEKEFHLNIPPLAWGMMDMTSQSRFKIKETFSKENQDKNQISVNSENHLQIKIQANTVLVIEIKDKK
ncbi:MAG: alpha-amylase family protein [Pseudarcicella sp.]|nr:alpha-amylase family protein [Pseudarcicella sp.]